MSERKNSPREDRRTNQRSRQDRQAAAWSRSAHLGRARERGQALREQQRQRELVARRGAALERAEPEHY